MTTVDMVNSPAHYGGKDCKYEAIKIIHDWCLGFSGGNALKYIIRAGRKGDRLEDLKKAYWYLCDALEIQEGCVESMPPGLSWQITVDEVVDFWFAEASTELKFAVHHIRHLEWREAGVVLATEIRRVSERS